MKNPLLSLQKKSTVIFHTGVKASIDRRFGALGLLSNDQIVEEKTKLNNMRNGKVRS